MALRGNHEIHDSATKNDCNSIQKVFKSRETIELEFRHKTCHNLDCYLCGKSTAFRRGKEIAMDILAYALTHNYKFVRFLSLNIITPSQARPLKDETPEGFKKRKKKLKKFELKEGETGLHYFERAKRIITRILNHEKNNLSAFCLIFHSDRMKLIDDIDVRSWSPHFHIICFDKLWNTKKFITEFGFGYRSQEKIDIFDSKKLKYLSSRIAYRINHCTIFQKKKKTDSITSFGNLSKNKRKITDKLKIKHPILDDFGNEFIRIKIDPDFTTSSRPSKLTSEILEIEEIILESNRTTGYPGTKNEERRNKLKNLRFLSDFALYEGWEKNYEIYYNPYKKELEEIILSENETIKFYLFSNGATTRVSSFQIMLTHDEIKELYPREKKQIPIVKKPIFDTIADPPFEFIKLFWR